MIRGGVSIRYGSPGDVGARDSAAIQESLGLVPKR